MSFLPTDVCQNTTPFRICQDKSNIEVRVIGDSIIRGQLTEFCGRSAQTRKRFCMPGARVYDVVAAVDTVTDRAKPNTLYVIQFGTNDVQTTRPEDLLDKYRRVIRRYKEKSRLIIVSGILPRINAYAGFHMKALSNNAKLRGLSSTEGVSFTSAWEHFNNRPNLSRDDGLHLNELGSVR